MIKKICFIFIIFLFISNCSLKKVEKHHGVYYLEEKQSSLIINKSNTNDIVSLLGPPSTKDTFENDVWIYIERVIGRKSLAKLGREQLIKNNVLILEINTQGLLVKKEFLDKNKMTKLEFSKNTTEKVYSRDSFVYDFLSSLRQKLNDPLGKRESRRKKNRNVD